MRSLPLRAAIAALAAVLLATAAMAPPAAATEPALVGAPAVGVSAPGSATTLPAPFLSCSWVPAPPAERSDYYAIELVPTGRVPGTRLAKGFAHQTAAVTPFLLALNKTQ